MYHSVAYSYYICVSLTDKGNFFGLSNFTYVSGAQPFGPDSQMCTNISIIDDQLVERTERFVVCGCSSQPEVIVHDGGCTNVYIEDNDSK